MKVGSKLINASFVNIEGKKPVSLETEKLFAGKKVIVFALPGAFTPTCSGTHLPRYEELYDTFKTQCGVDEIYCLSVNDGFVMQRWFEASGVKKVKMIADGNTHVCKALDILIDKEKLGFGLRARRSSFFINDNTIEHMFLEALTDGDPFEVSDADTMLKALNGAPKMPPRIVVFGVDTCEVCQKTKKYMADNHYPYEYITMTEGNKQKIMGALKDGHKTTPLIFVNGEYVGGFDDFQKKSF